MSETTLLKKLYKSLTGEGALPLEPDAPYYVPILESSPEKDPILALWQRIDLADSESINLLTGFRGNGKSTELRRLKRKLQEDGCQVFLVNMLDYVLMTKPLELSDFILSLMAALAGAMEQCEEYDLKPLSQGYWERMQTFLESEVELEKISMTGRAGDAAAGLAFQLKTDPNFKQKIQQHLQGHLTRLVQDAREFVDGLVVEIRNQAKDPDKKVVFLVDSLEQLRGSGDEAENIYASTVELFSGQAANLQFPKFHIVYTIPPYLPALAHNIGRTLGGHPVTQWPNIHVRSKDNSDDADGLRVMTRIIDKRIKNWRDLIPEKYMLQMASASGGDLRDFFRLIRECAISLRTARFAESEAVLDSTMVEWVIQQLRNELLPLADEDAEWLAKIHETKREALHTERDLPALARFLDSNLIMNYLNGEPWYDIHPLLITEVQSRQVNDSSKT